MSFGNKKGSSFGCLNKVRRSRRLIKIAFMLHMTIYSTNREYSKSLAKGYWRSSKNDEDTSEEILDRFDKVSRL